ncbi:MAG TPA: PqqD family protein [Bacteroidetes bacterium]|nr:PqqD family protein [Bacteroidota bacterium]
MIRLKRNIAVSDTGFVFDPSTGETFTVNETGMRIIHYLREGKDPREIASLIIKEYNIDSLSFEKYFQDFTEMLKQFNMLEYEKEV